MGDGWVSVYDQIGAIANTPEPDSRIITMPSTLSFCKTSKFSHILALSDGQGYVTLFDTCQKFPANTSFQKNAEKSKICEWCNRMLTDGVYNVCWIKEDTQIVTACEETVWVWDVQEKKCVGELMGHRALVATICSHSIV